LAPSHVPAPLIESLALDFQKIMAMPEYRAFRGERGLAALNLSERDFSRFVAQQRKVWEQAVEFFNINAEEAFAG
jgi:tripartite-type tricarboxylate transporter receptor subunit TctC